jgi:hypothetical protein
MLQGWLKVVLVSSGVLRSSTLLCFTGFEAVLPQGFVLPQGLCWNLVTCRCSLITPPLHALDIILSAQQNIHLALPTKLILGKGLFWSLGNHFSTSLPFPLSNTFDVGISIVGKTPSKLSPDLLGKIVHWFS